MKTYVRLIQDSYPFKKGTEFVVTGGDDGFWSRYAFHSGVVLVNGKEENISVERKNCQYISAKKYKSKVFVEEEWLNPQPMTESDFWREWINSPG